jgi:hypothetical protein
MKVILVVFPLHLLSCRHISPTHLGWIEVRAGRRAIYSSIIVSISEGITETAFGNISGFGFGRITPGFHLLHFLTELSEPFLFTRIRCLVIFILWLLALYT